MAGIEAPPGNPWGGCAHDPLHVTLVQHSGWERDQSQAEFYSAVATVLGFTFGGSDGFTQDVEHDYVAAPNARTTYICGDAIGQNPTHAPILYDTP